MSSLAAASARLTWGSLSSGAPLSVLLEGATSMSTARPVPSKLSPLAVIILATVMTTALPSLMRWGSAWMVPLP